MEDMKKKKLDTIKLAEIITRLPTNEQERVLGFIEAVALSIDTDGNLRSA